MPHCTSDQCVRRCARAGEDAVRVLMLTQHFPPEVTAGRFRVEAFARAIVSRGHECRVICPVPNHPSGVIEEG